MINNTFVQEEFDEFLEKITNADVYKRETAKIFQHHETRLIEQHEQLPDWINREEHGPAYFVRYSSPSTAEETTVTTKTYKLDDQLELNTLHQLKTYQWLLAEAYEAFEDYLERVYADCGIRGSSLWVRPDGWKYDGSKDLSHYYNPTHKRKGTPFLQLKALRERSAHFREYEARKGMHYRVTFVLIEKLRHLIVHEGGYCKDFESFMKSIQQQLNAVSMKDVRSYVDSYFIPHRGAKLIHLLELPVEDGPRALIGAHYDEMGALFTTLIEYALLVKESIELADTKPF
jgi:hypothetical protein